MIIDESQYKVQISRNAKPSACYQALSLLKGEIFCFSSIQTLFGHKKIGPDGDRTHYLLVANETLSQMSYRPSKQLY